MTHKIDWNTAAVTGGTLTVRLAAYEEGVEWSRVWEHAVNALASEPLPGVPYAPADPWGQIRVTNGVIEVQNVPDRAVDSIRAQLEAAVAAADDEMEQRQKEQERAKAAQRERDDEVAARDQGLTDRFRQFGNQ